MPPLEGGKLIGRMLESLVRFKDKLKKQDEIAAYCDEPDPPVVEEIDEDDEDDDPLTWAEQKNVRKELRRFQLWHALRLRVPKGFEEG